MPLYEYRCRSCNHQFEIQQSFSDDALHGLPRVRGRAAQGLQPRRHLVQGLRVLQERQPVLVLVEQLLDQLLVERRQHVHEHHEGARSELQLLGLRVELGFQLDQQQLERLSRPAQTTERVVSTPAVARWIRWSNSATSTIFTDSRDRASARTSGTCGGSASDSRTSSSE